MATVEAQEADTETLHTSIESETTVADTAHSHFDTETDEHVDDTEDAEFSDSDDASSPTTDKHQSLPIQTNVGDITADHSPASLQLQTPPGLASPMTPHESHHMSMDSMTSIALSETSLDYDHLSAEQADDNLATPKVSRARHLRKPSSLDILRDKWSSSDGDSTFFDTADRNFFERTMSDLSGQHHEWNRPSSHQGVPDAICIYRHSLQDSFTNATPSIRTNSWSSRIISPRRASGGSSSESETQLDWQALDKTEEQEKEDKELPDGIDDESTAFLLARLEQENAKFTDFQTPVANKTVARARAQSRPVSMAHIKKLVTNQGAPTIRYSLVPDLSMPEEPPPMTELEFWAALVQDYPSTAARLPTLTTSKIRSGIPAPLRGVVWTAMSGARDGDLEEAFERLVGEKSPYEGIINKDVGRSFPGVDLFRDAEGEGQKMLGRVLKCFSLQDKDIGYCQGLGFLVGPLLMNMGEREAFCTLVRLMDHYSLRPSFLPSLSGLHMRIYQFSSLLKKHHPQLSDHLSQLGVEPAYISQWFLSCFAVTCPLPMLFRIYDVIFAEGANETVMRVAVALMRRHEERMLNATEFEEIMQLLLGRTIWDCYGGDADELVDDFTSLGDIVTHAGLAELEREFENQSADSGGQSAGFLPDVQAAASRFLGRLWAPGHTPAQSKASTAHTPKASVSTLSPQSSEKETLGLSLFGRPGNFLRRTPSKQSIVTANDGSGSEDSTSTAGSGGASIASTAPTELDIRVATATSDSLRESVIDAGSINSKQESLAPMMPSAHSREQQNLHGQIEDLLNALTEMQREHAQLAAMLQREREERSEDHRIMRQLIGKYNKGRKEDRRRTMPVPPKSKNEDESRLKSRPLSLGNRQEAEAKAEKADKPTDEFDDTMEKVQERLSTNIRSSASLETKAQLRGTLSRTREQLLATEARSRELLVKLEVAESSAIASQSEGDDLRSEVKELRTRVNDDFKARQKLEHQLSELKAQARSIDRKQSLIRSETLNEVPMLTRKDSSSDGRARTSSVASLPAGGLRELKLGRRESMSSVQSLRALRNIPSSHSEPSAMNRPQSEVFSPVDSASTSPIQIKSPDTSLPSVSAPFPDAGSLGIPTSTRSSFGRRTSSLVVQEVIATPEHEPVPEEALLLELVNAKTSEAQARQEVDELKRALAVSKRKQDEAQRKQEETLEELKADLEKTKTELTKVADAAQTAKAESEAAKSSSTASVPSGSGFSLPPTPGVEESTSSSVTSTPAVSPAAGGEPGKKSESVASLAGGWFWSRRTASKSSVPTVSKDGGK